MKFYLIATDWSFGKIEECEVIKETQKTYTIKRDGWGTHLIKKSEMTMYKGFVCKTLEEAREKFKELLNQRILNSENRIERLKFDIRKYNSMLDDMRKEDEGK